MARLLRYLRRYRGRYLLGAACLIATASLAMAIPYLLKTAVDGIEQGAPFVRISLVAVAIIGVAIVQGIVRTFSRALIFNVGRDVEYDLRNDLFLHLSRLPTSYYQTHQTGDLMSRMVNDVTAVRLLLGVGALNLINTPLYYAYGVTIMLSLDVPLTALSLLPFPVLLLAVKRISRRLMEQTLRVQEGLAGLSTAVQENVSGIHVVKAYAAEGVATERFRILNTAFIAQSDELARIRGQLIPLMKIVSGLGTLVVLTYGGHQVIRGALGIGDLVAFLGYLNLLAWPTLAMGWMLSILQRGRAAMQRLEEVFRVEPDIRDTEEATPLPSIEGRIELRDIDFAYDGSARGHRALTGLSLVAEPGEHVAIVGRTGAGKTSLVQLLPRLFDSTAGSVLIDGHDVRTIPLTQLRRAIAVVPQDPFLFSTTIRENIAFAMDDPDEAAIRRAAERAGVASDIASFPDGYDTVVGERGVMLSGGQKQRITLARALAANPRILILDDSLSSVDVRTEREILGHLKEFMCGRTVVWIAHRISTLRDAGRIAVIDDGRLIELGDHATLMARNGVYAELYRQQQLAEEIEEL